MGRKDKLALLKDLHGEDGFEEIEGSNHLRINGERAYVLDPTRSLSVRHELVADLAATGLKPAEIGRLVKSNGSKSDGGYYATLLRDPRMRQRARCEIGDALEQAKAKIKSVVVKAAENISEAVQQGDLKESHFVLATQGVTDKLPPVSNNVNLDFGSLLGQLKNTKQIHDISGNTAERKIHEDTDALPPATGKTLVIKE